MNKHDALIFDVDGTLWDAAHVSAHGWNKALAGIGLPARVTTDDIRSVSGRPFAQCVEALLPGLRSTHETLLESLEREERAAFDTLAGELYEGVAGGFPRLAAVYPLFVVSNCPDWYLDTFLRVTGFGRYLAGYDCHGISGMSKGEMLESMRQSHRITRGVYVGDTQSDRDAAEAAGLEFAFVRYGFGRAGVGHADAGLSFGSFDEAVEHFLAAPGG